MKTNKIVSPKKWLAERKKLLKKEKQFTRQRDKLSALRQKLPWVAVDKDYSFDGPNGKETLSDLFAGKNQLLIYHFMFGPDWDQGCPSCSFWADNYEGISIHLAHRDISFLAISRCPLNKIEAFKKRMGWNFKWVSSLKTDFNYDFQVSFKDEEFKKKKMFYNYTLSSFPSPEAPGVSVFIKKDGKIYHTYSTYSRGLDMLNGAYNYLDIVPKGRDEKSLPYTMAWLRHHDKYETS